VTQMFSYIIPTRNRPEVLIATLAQLRRLHDTPDAPAAEVVLIDNASERPLPAERLRETLGGRLSLSVLYHKSNAWAASRNIAAAAADSRSRWLVMLDDDSAPLDLGFVPLLTAAAADVSAIAAEIWLPPQGGRPRRESGGLPEVFIGCGVAIRRECFLPLGGYDPSFNYYAEEYDLAARMIAAGGRVCLDRRFRVLHRKVTAGRDMNLILQRLVRNNAVVAARYAPAAELVPAIAETLTRYASIAIKEDAMEGYLLGVAELAARLWRQRRTPLTREQWDRFTGLAAARKVACSLAQEGETRVSLIAPGKNQWAVRRAVTEAGLTCVGADAAGAVPRLVATLSPGPAWDAAEAARTLPNRQGSGGSVWVPFVAAGSSIEQESVSRANRQHAADESSTADSPGASHGTQVTAREQSRSHAA
jgi:GT2 family glycosyltransferase